MKTQKTFLNLLCPILFAIVLAGCGEQETYPKYEYAVEYYVPDSIMPVAREWIKETIRATNQHLSAGDYEDVWRTIRVSKEEGLELFGVRMPGLRKIKYERQYEPEFIPQERMTCFEKEIFERKRINCN